MKAKNAKKEFDKFIKAKGLTTSSLTPRTALDLVLEFYQQMRAEDCPLDEDGDMLLYQWGNYDEGKAKSFHFDLTRQFIVAGSEDDDGMSQLSLTLHFDPTPELKSIEDGNEWCYSPDDLANFRKFIEESEPYQAVAELKPKDVTFRFSPI